jgi:hypothetical protein
MSPAARRRLAGAASAALVALLAALAPLAVFCVGFNYLHGAYPFNSDNLWCNAFCEDLLSGADLTGWNFPGAPYLFPDILLLLPCQWLGRDLVAVYFAYDALFYAAFLAALYALARQVGLGRRAAFVTAAAALTFLAVTHLRDDYRAVGQLMGHPGNHIGAILVGVVLLALFARALRRGHGRAGAAAFVTVGALGTVSDNLLVVQFLLPACLALGLLWLWRKLPFGQLARHAAAVAAALLLAEGLRLLVQCFGCQFEGFKEDVRRPRPGDLTALLTQVWRVVNSEYVLLAFLALTVLAALLVLWARRGAGRADDAAGRPALFVALAVLLSPACNLLALLVLGMGTHNAAIRYCVVLYLVPFLFPGLLLRLLPGRAARLGGAALLAFVVALALHQFRLLLPAVGRDGFAQPYPPLAQAIDRLVAEHGPMQGVAGYWSARELSFLTRSRTRIVPLLTDCSPFPHGGNSRWYIDRRPGRLALPDYRLIVVAESRGLAPRPEVLAAHFGEPRQKVRVGPDQLWLYDRLDNAAFDRFLLAQVAPRLRRALPAVAPEWPWALARPKANGTPSDARRVWALGPGQELEVRFPRPVSARLLDVAADYREHGRLLFYRGAEAVGELALPSVPWTNTLPHWKPGQQARLLEVPPALRGRPWDRVVVRPSRTGLHVGHLLAYERDVPGLFPPAPGAAGPHRYEAEEMYSLAPPESVVADPQASGGKARQAPPGFGGCLTHGPYVALRPGRYQLDVRLGVDDNSSAEPAVRVEVFANWDVDRLAAVDLRGADFPAGGGYVTRRLTFEAGAGLDTVQFRTVPLGKARVRVDYFELTRRPPGPG